MWIYQWNSIIFYTKVHEIQDTRATNGRGLLKEVSNMNIYKISNEDYYDKEDK